jgi:hypothetical protein
MPDVLNHPIISLVGRFRLIIEIYLWKEWVALGKIRQAAKAWSHKELRRSGPVLPLGYRL